MKSKRKTLPELETEMPIDTTQPTVSGTLKAPMRGDDVKVLQKELFRRKYLKNEEDIDGIFLAVTTTALKQFQKENELTADGIAGALTLSKLGIAVKQVNPPLPVDPAQNPFKYADGTPEFYLAAFKWLTIDKGFETLVANTAKKLISNLEIYQDVVNTLGIKFKESDYKKGEYIHPAVFVGAIHNLESGMDFAGVLHNGEKIIGKGLKTTLVPKGHGPFGTWKQAAIDALTLKNVQAITDWSVSNILKTLERYNGTGYLTGAGKAEYSPYLWSQSSVNDNLGKYIKDGKFDPSANANGQTGAATLTREVYKLLQVSTVPEKEVSESSLVSKVISLNPKIEPRMVKRAVPFLENPAIKNEKYFLAINWSLHETLARAYVIEIETGKVLHDEKVAIGNKSDLDNDGYADENGFSNVNGSNKSSLGAILIGPKFHNPKWKHVYFLYGLEPKLNGNIQKREILLHSTTYVNDTTGAPIGETLGCLGFSVAAVERIMPYLKDALVYCWAEQLEK